MKPETRPDEAARSPDAAAETRFDPHRWIASVLALAASGALLAWAVAYSRIL